MLLYVVNDQKPLVYEIMVFIHLTPPPTFPYPQKLHIIFIGTDSTYLKGNDFLIPASDCTFTFYFQFAQQAVLHIAWCRASVVFLMLPTPSTCHSWQRATAWGFQQSPLSVLKACLLRKTAVRHRLVYFYIQLSYNF